MRLTKTEIAQHRAVLESWQKPSLMLKRGRALMRIMGSEDLFTQPGVGFIFEAWAAGQFAKGRSALRVRLVSAREQWPDFEVKTRAGRAEPWEFTEVQHPRRRRGDEYRKIAARRAAGKSMVRGVSIARLAKQAAHVPVWLRRACRAKAAKYYSGRAGLLVYLNWNEFGSRQEQVEQSFPAATKVARSAFSEIWVLWKARIYRTWNNGLPAPLIRNIRAPS